MRKTALDPRRFRPPSRLALGAFALGGFLFLPSAFAQEPAPSSEAAPSDVVDKIQLPSNSVQEVLSLYEMLTGKRLIRDANLAGPPLSIIVPEELPKRDAIALIESVLLLNGYSLVPVDERTVKVLGSAKSPLGESVPLYADPASLPQTEQIVSYFMLFKYISTKDALTVFENYVTRRPQGGSIIAVPNSNAIVITDNTPLVRRLIALQRLIDVPGAKILTEFITLTRADAEKVADTINKLLDKEKDDENKRAAAEAGQPPPPQPVNAQPQQPGSGGGAAMTQINSVVQVVADVRTNRILVVAPENRMPYLRQLIHDLDVGVSFEEPLERPLKFVGAGDVLPVLQSILAEGGEEPSSGSGATQPGTTGATQDTFSPSTGGGTSGSGGGGKPDKLSAPRENNAPLAAVVGKVRIIADRSANSIIVIGPPESRIKAARVLDMLDRRPKQVYLATIIGQFTLGDGIEVGFDYLIKFKNFNPGGPTTGLGGLLRTRTAGTDLLPDPSALITNNTLPILSGLTIYGTIAETVDVYAKALATTNRFKVLSRPVVYTANNKKAVISSGQQVPIPVSTLSSVVSTTPNVAADTGTALASNIQYKDVVLKLEVIPLVNSDDEVTLTIAQQNDNILERVVVSNNEVPVIGTQELTTTITVRNRNTIVLGGLITEEKTRNVTGIPLLSSIPGVGYLFSTTRKQTTRRELIILIQPLIINSEADLAEANYIEKSMSSFNKEFYEGNIPIRRADPAPFKMQAAPIELPRRNPSEP